MSGQRDEAGNEDKRFRYRRRRNGNNFTDIEWARAATKHGISRERSRFVVEQAALFWEKRPPEGGLRKELRLMFFGDDYAGVPLEVFGVKLQERRLIVIHAMLLRPRFRETYEEARRC
jgi:hypothetical protein